MSAPVTILGFTLLACDRRSGRELCGLLPPSVGDDEARSTLLAEVLKRLLCMRFVRLMPV